MKNTLKTWYASFKTHTLPKLKRFIALWPGTWGILVALAILVVSYPLLLLIQGADMNIGLLDPGLIQNIPFATLELVFLNEIIFIGIMLNFPIIWHWYKKNIYKNDWLNLTPYQRWLTFLLLFSIFFLSGTLILTSLQ